MYLTLERHVLQSVTHLLVFATYIHFFVELGLPTSNEITLAYRRILLRKFSLELQKALNGARDATSGIST